MAKTDSDQTKIAVMSSTMTRMGADLSEIKNDIKDLKGTYSSKEELQGAVKILEEQIKAVDTKYELPRSLIFGLCALVLIAFIGAVISLIIMKHP